MKKETKKILVVDDDEDLLNVFKEILQQDGYHIDTAETSKRAIEKSNLKNYHLALLDIQLPDMEGTQLLTKLQPQTVKIMITGHPSLENAIEAVNKGVDAYLLKPVNPNDLLQIVEERLRLQEENEKLNRENVAEWIKLQFQKLQVERFQKKQKR